MSHFIGLVFVNTEKDTLVDLLAPYDEQTDDEQYVEFTDCTEEIQEKFDSLPEKDERLDKDGKPYQYLCDKEHYPTFESLAEDWFGYRKNADGIYGYTCNPDAKWDWFAIGNRWNGYLYGKDGKEYNQLPLDDVDWEKMFKKVEETYTNYKGEEETYISSHVPFCLVDRDGYWHEKGEMGWFGMSYGDKDQDVWDDEVKTYVKHLTELPGGERKAIVVYAVYFHI
jgi:hypothetical protein